MANAVAAWRTPSGQYRNASSADKTVFVSVKAACDVDPTGEGGIDHVTFHVSVNGGTATDYDVSARTVEAANYEVSAFNGRHLTTAFHLLVDLEALDGGKVEVTAEVVSAAGNSTALAGSIIIRNDTDGVDRRPSPKTIWCSPATGTAGGAGTEADPTDTLSRAILLAVANPAGSSEADRDCGGATINIMDPMVGFGGTYGSGSWHTSSGWVLTIRAVGATKTVQRIDPAVGTYPQDNIIGGGFGGAGTCNVDWHDCEFVGSGPVIYATGTTVYTTQEFACQSHSSYWVPAPAKPHADYAADGGAIIGWDGSGTGARRRYSWSGTFNGKTYGAVGYAGLFDFEITHILGVSVQSVTEDCDDFCYSNGIISDIRYHPGEIDGYTDTSFEFVVTAGANVAITVPVAGQMRIDATNSTPRDFGNEMAGLVGGAGLWGALISGATSAGNNGCFEVLEAGTNGFGRPYCILSNASAVAETGGASLRILTARLSNSVAYNDIHPDVLQMFGDHTNFMWSEIRVENCRDTRSIVGAGRTLVDGCIEDSNDGSHASSHTCEFDWASASLTNVLFHGVSVNGPASFSGPTSGVNFIDCAFTQGVNVPTGAGVFTSHCHFVDGFTSGLSPTSGAWFDTEPGDSPYSYAPKSERRSTASGLLGRPTDWWFSGATADSRGAPRNVTDDDYGAAVDVVAAGDLPPAAWAPMAGSAPYGVAASGDLPAASWSPMAGEALDSTIASGDLPAAAWSPAEGSVTFGVVASGDLPAMVWSPLKDETMAIVPGILLTGGRHIQGGDPGLAASWDSLAQTTLSYLRDRTVLRITPDNASTGAPTASALDCYPWYDGNANDDLLVVTASSTTSATCTQGGVSPGWTTDEWVGRTATFLNLTPFAGIGFQRRAVVTANTANVLTFAAGTAPAVGAIAFVGKGRFRDYHPVSGWINATGDGSISLRGGSAWQANGLGVGYDAGLIRHLFEGAYKESPYFHCWKYASIGPIITHWGDSPYDAGKAPMLLEYARVTAAATALGNTIDWQVAVIDYFEEDLQQAIASPFTILTYETRLREFMAWLTTTFGVEKFVLINHRSDTRALTAAGGAPWLRAAHVAIARDTANVGIVDFEGEDPGIAGDHGSADIKFLSLPAYIKGGKTIGAMIQRLNAGVSVAETNGGFPVYIYLGDSTAVGQATSAWTLALGSERISGPTVGSLVRPTNQKIWNRVANDLQTYTPHTNSNTSGSVTATAAHDLSIMAALGELHPNGFALVKRGSNSSALATELSTYSAGSGGRWMKSANQHYPELQADFADCVAYINETLGMQADMRGAFITLGTNDQSAIGGAAFAAALPGFCEDIWTDFGTRTGGEKFPISWRLPQTGIAPEIPAELALVQGALLDLEAAESQLVVVNVDDLERDRSDNLHETPESAVVCGDRMVTKLRTRAI